MWNWPNNNANSDLSFFDFLNLISLYYAILNLQENRQQSAQSDQLIKQIDVDAANDRQAQKLLDELGRKFDEQNRILEEQNKELSEIREQLDTLTSRVRV